MHRKILTLSAISVVSLPLFCGCGEGEQKHPGETNINLQRGREAFEPETSKSGYDGVTGTDRIQIAPAGKANPSQGAATAPEAGEASPAKKGSE